MSVTDTTPRAAAIFAELNRAAGPERRFAQALEMSSFALGLARAGLRSRHPHLTDEELMRALVRLVHPDVKMRNGR